MRLNHVPFARVLIDSYHSMQCQSVIKPINCGLYPMIILQQNSIIFKLKAFWMLHLNDHLYSKPCFFLWVANFRGLTAGFTSIHTLSRAFTVEHICITKNNEAFTQRGIHPYLLLPDTYFHFYIYNRATLLDIVPLYLARVLYAMKLDETQSCTLLPSPYRLLPLNAMSKCDKTHQL